MRFSILGGRTGIYARVTAQRLKGFSPGALALFGGRTGIYARVTRTKIEGASALVKPG